MTTGPGCRFCGGEVFVWKEEAPEKAVCPNCCEHPEYEYEGQGDGWRCVVCFGEAPDSYFEGWGDDH